MAFTTLFRVQKDRIIPGRFIPRIQLVMNSQAVDEWLMEGWHQSIEEATHDVIKDSESADAFIQLWHEQF